MEKLKKKAEKEKAEKDMGGADKVHIAFVCLVLCAIYFLILSCDSVAKLTDMKFCAGLFDLELIILMAS